MIFGERIDISGTLELKSDLHIGTAEKHRYSDCEEIREYSATLRDANGQPFIPSSTLKGAVRDALSVYDEGLTKDLLGYATELPIQSGKAAQLWIDHAFMSKAVADQVLEGIGTSVVGNGVYHSKHVAIDPETGSAAPNKLFDKERVRRGAQFEFLASWFDQQNEDEDIESKVFPVLALLANGVRLGAGIQKGHGLLQLDTTTIGLKKFTAHNGQLVSTPLSLGSITDRLQNISIKARDEKTIRLQLSCKGPFMSIGRQKENDLLPMEQNGRPHIQSESIVGALRSRARWIAELEKDESSSQSVDAPSRKRNRQELHSDNLTQVENLFGVASRRAKVRLKSVSCTSPGDRITLTSNSIDRLTGATRDGALFNRTAFWQPTFEIELEVEGEHPILERTLKSFAHDPLEIGHGSGVGFGWFDVETLT